jgi:hypothetical protein
MLTRAISAAALTLCLFSSTTSNAVAAGHQPGFLHRVSCSVVRYYVARYSVSTAEMWARSHGATEAEIAAARRCLDDMPAQTAQAQSSGRWFSQ